MKMLPAAAIPEGAVVRMPGLIQGTDVTFIIASVDNSTPTPGWIHWVAEDAMEVDVRASEMVEIVRLP